MDAVTPPEESITQGTMSNWSSGWDITPVDDSEIQEMEDQCRDIKSRVTPQGSPDGKKIGGYDLKTLVHSPEFKPRVVKISTSSITKKEQGTDYTVNNANSTWSDPSCSPSGRHSYSRLRLQCDKAKQQLSAEYVCSKRVSPLSDTTAKQTESPPSGTMAKQVKSSPERKLSDADRKSSHSSPVKGSPGVDTSPYLHQRKRTPCSTPGVSPRSDWSATSSEVIHCDLFVYCI